MNIPSFPSPARPAGEGPLPAFRANGPERGPELRPAARRLESLEAAGFRPSLLPASEVYLDLLAGPGEGGMGDLAPAPASRAGEAGSAGLGALAGRLEAAGLPALLPLGARGCRLDARAFLPRLPRTECPAEALAVALFIVSGVRGGEGEGPSAGSATGGREMPAHTPLLLLAPPGRPCSLAQLRYIEDRLEWLHANRGLVGGLRVAEARPALGGIPRRLAPLGDIPRRLAPLGDIPRRLAPLGGIPRRLVPLGGIPRRLAPLGDWPRRLAARFEEDFGSAL